MNSKKQCGDKEILFTETFICADNDSDIIVNMDFMPQYRLQMTFRWKFIDDKDVANGNQHMNIESGNNEFIFTIYNSENPFGTGNLHPIPIAMLGNHVAYLFFRFNRPDKGMPRLFTYTIVIDNEVSKHE